MVISTSTRSKSFGYHIDFPLVLITAIAVVMGLWSAFTFGASFTSNFWTTLRARRNADSKTEVIKPGVAGQAPLPKELSRPTVRFCREMKIDHKSTSTYNVVEQGLEDDAGASRGVEEISTLRDSVMLQLDYGDGADDWGS